MRRLALASLAFALLTQLASAQDTNVTILKQSCTKVEASPSKYTVWLNATGTMGATTSDVYTINGTKEFLWTGTTGDIDGGTAATIAACPTDANSKTPGGNCFYFNTTSNTSFLTFAISSFDLVASAASRIGFLVYISTIVANDTFYDIRNTAQDTIYAMSTYGALGDVTFSLKSNGTGTYPSGTSTTSRYFSNGTACTALTVASGWHYVEMLFYGTGSSSQIWNAKVDGTQCGDIWTGGDDLKVLGTLEKLQVGATNSVTAAYYIKNFVVTNDNTIDLFSVVCGSDMTGTICATGAQQGDYCH